MSNLLSVPEVARKLSCSEQKARRLMRSLPHVRVGKLLRISEAVLDDWITRGGNEYAAQPWQGTSGCSYVGGSGGSGVTTQAGTGGKRARANVTRLPPSSRPAISSAVSQVLQIAERLKQRKRKAAA